MVCQYIEGVPEGFVYHYTVDGKSIEEMESTTKLYPCKSVAVRELDIEGLKICYCGKHSQALAKQMRIAGKEVSERVI